MNKLLVNIKYKARYQLAWVAWYVIPYIVVLTITYFMLVKNNIINSQSGSLGYRLWSAIIFQFAVSMKFKEDFDFFLTMGNSRFDIFKIMSGTAAFFSFLLGVLVVVEKLVLDFINNYLGFYIKDIFHYFSPYHSDNLLFLFLFFGLLSCFFSMLGIFIGSLFYRYGRKLILTFWLGFSSIVLILLPLILWGLYQQNQLFGIINKVGKYLAIFNVRAASGILFFMAIFSGLVACLNMKRLGQK